MSTHNIDSRSGLLILALLMLPISVSFSQQEIDDVSAELQTSAENDADASPAISAEDQLDTAESIKEETLEAETRELSVEENPEVARRAARAAEREAAKEQEEVVESVEEAEEISAAGMENTSDENPNGQDENAETVVKSEETIEAETRELSVEENPEIARRAARAAEREAAKEQEEVVESIEEAEEIQESPAVEISESDIVETTEQSEESIAEVEAESEEIAEAETRELGAEENPAVSRRAARAAEREAANEQEEMTDSVEEIQEIPAVETPESDIVESTEKNEESIAEVEAEAETRELGAEENPAVSRRAARETEREEAEEIEEASEQVQEEFEEAVERELAVEKDPALRDQAERDADREEMTAASSAPEHDTGVNFYGSLRVRSRGNGDGEGELEDASSRVGTDIELEFKQGSYLFARYEVGFNLLAATEYEEQDGTGAGERFSESVFTRLAYIGIDTPILAATMGKSWSTYYSVSSFTDRFMGTGASASGTFNAQTAGGASGTGRADGVVQSSVAIDFLPEKWFKPFDLNFQIQRGNTIPFSDGVDFGSAFGVSAILTTQKNYTVGIAYNQANTHLDENPSLQDIGISGNAKALVIGTRAYGSKWYAGFLVSHLTSHETTNDGIYFDGWGSEFYGQYQLSDRLWLTAGYNDLKPDRDEDQAGLYRIRYGVAGLRYTFDNFKRMIYANIRYDKSKLADGTSRSNVYTIGIKWDLKERGWSFKSGTDVPPPSTLD